MYSLLQVRCSVQMANAFVEWVDSLMKESKYSNAEFARRGGVSESYISKIRNEERGVGYDFCVAVSQVFNVPLTEVYRNAGLLPPVSKATSDKEQLLYLYDQLKPEGQEDLISYAHFLLEKQERSA